MKRVLSIDWDFFIDATMSQRLRFPDGGSENINTSIRDYIWDTYYARDPELPKIRVSQEYEGIMKICRDFNGRRAFIADSHKYIYDFVKDNISTVEKVEIYNIDFHHDLYHYETRGEEVNCGNWGNKLLEQYPKMSIHWVKRPDSQLESIGGVPVDAELLTFVELVRKFGYRFDRKNFDYLFLCRSAVWSPPHLDPYFVKLAKEVFELAERQGIPLMYEKGIFDVRPYELPESINPAWGDELTIND